MSNINLNINSNNDNEDEDEDDLKLFFLVKRPLDVLPRKHGKDWHSSMLVSHLSPVNPGKQLHA